MKANQFWWPLDLSESEQSALEEFKANILKQKPKINQTLNKQVIDKLDRLMKINLADIIEKDGLPHHCHLINGWGNSVYRGEKLIHGIELFAHCNANGDHFILQCNAEGDFHPWQSFAYAIMAGIDPNMSLSIQGFTLTSLSKNSREINTDKGIELGHLLFALSHLEPTKDIKPFYLKGKEHSVRNLMELAVEAHHYGSFDVCRKFHLTEGLCAASVKIPGLENYQKEAQGFLDGQLDMLLLLGIVLQEVRKSIENNFSVREDSLLFKLRDTLRFGHLIENHVYYAGHLIELAGFAASFGFKVKSEHWYTMNYIINELNLTFPEYLSHVSFQEHFYAFGHYRRAVTLLQEVEKRRKSANELVREDLEKFSINFDKLLFDKSEFSKKQQKPPSIDDGGVYNISFISRTPREKFSNIIKEYSNSAPQVLKPRGKFEHFRRIGPPTWPRAFHYELLDYNDKFGIEIHLESASVVKVLPFVKDLYQKIKDLFPDNEVKWEDNWRYGYGRMKILFEECSYKEVAAGMKKLIQNTFSDLDPIVSSLDAASYDLHNETLHYSNVPRVYLFLAK
ncbi:hypothetical protein AWC38_SpisGene23716 [Stylophora pistillata]|uniref:Uncharacterized protein n=1 Tax=Stylophora pistillata TaxID=50429 RepID=A0A2B4R7M0_STYPI|nr:hypothetical protein AWC38_SpisGene23716 [Stylophora pistillata]